MLLAPSENTVKFKGRRYEPIAKAPNYGFGVLVIIFSSVVELSYNRVGPKH